MPAADHETYAGRELVRETNERREEVPFQMIDGIEWQSRLELTSSPPYFR